jgi:hypothetical protein
MASGRKKNQWWRDDELILVLNAGAVALAVKRGWTVEGKPEGMGHLELKDPSDSCSLQISCLMMPPAMPGPPPIDQMLREVLQKEHPGAMLARIETSRRGEVNIAWMDYARDEKDTERDEWRVAHARVLFACNMAVGAFLTFNYWEDDTTWAVAAWERMVETLQIGEDGMFTRNTRNRRN